MIKPIGERVLIEIEKIEEKTAGGIILPTTTENNNSNTGVIVAIGDLEKVKLEIGDKVIYEKFSGYEIKENDKKYLILNIENILAVVK